jgi:hypothetical protein
VIEGGDVAHAAAYDHDIRIKNVDDARNGAGKTVVIAVKGGKGGGFSALGVGDNVVGGEGVSGDAVVVFLKTRARNPAFDAPPLSHSNIVGPRVFVEKWILCEIDGGRSLWA